MKLKLETWNSPHVVLQRLEISEARLRSAVRLKKIRFVTTSDAMNPRLINLEFHRSAIIDFEIQYADYLAAAQEEQRIATEIQRIRDTQLALEL